MVIKKAEDFAEGVVLLIDKPLDWTSFDVVNKVRAMLGNHLHLNKIKVGHAGTLDPLATGLLILCTGKTTKKIESFTGMDKEYTGTITLGATTRSYDLETAIERTYSTGHITAKAIRSTAMQFTGKVTQLPPVFSAKWVDGQKAYVNARKGKNVEMKPITVTVNTFKITRVSLPEVDFTVNCSKGTYIRSLAFDFGKALGSGAYLSRLCRTKIGPHKLQDAYSITKLEALIKNLSKRPLLSH